MNYSYKEYLTDKKKETTWFKNFKIGIEGLADIPFVGNTVKTGVSLITDHYKNNSKFKASVKSIKHDTTYFVLESDDYHHQLCKKVFKILEENSVREKFNIDLDKIGVEILEYIDEENWQLIDEALTITFFDNKYFNEKLNEHEYGTVAIVFKESFKQINFENSRVYTAFETISYGYGSDYNKSTKRDYIELANLIGYILSNPSLM